MHPIAIAPPRSRFLHASRRGLRLLAGTALAGLLAACAAPPSKEHTAQVQVERIDRAFELDKSVTRVEIVNPLGEINVRDNDEAEVGVHAVIQRLAPGFADVRLASRRSGGVLRIEASVADRAPGRIDMAVYVPSTMALSLATRDGRISVSRRRGSIEAKTTTGEISAASTGRLELASGSGEIRATAIGRRWKGESRITTDSGRIVLKVPTFGDIALDAQTGGRLVSGFGLSVHEREGIRSSRARYGRGTSPLVARSRSGEIVLDQLVLLGEDGGLSEDQD